MNALFKLIRSVSLNTIMPKTSGFYAVKVGKQSGVFRTWAECQEQVKGYPGAKFKKFSTKEEAKKFVEDPIPVTTSAPQKRKLTQSSSAVTKKRKVEADSSTSKSDSSKSKSDSSTIKSDDPLEHTSGDAVVVYTDGCCHFNGMKGSCGGLGVFWGVDHPDNLSEKLEGRQSNNRAEIMAVVRALQQAKTKGIKHLEVRTDSNFLISCMTKWIDAWKKRGWLLANGNPVINREELELLDAEQKDIKVTYVYVKGHVGIEGNEQADRLAKQGSKK